jgi:transcriptional regulator with XRE-family HTH domain
LKPAPHSEASTKKVYAYGGRKWIVKSAAKPGAVLKSLRLRRGWTQSEVSQRTGLPISSLSKVENDKMSLSYDKLVRISKGLDIDISLLFAQGETVPGETVPVDTFRSGRRCITRAGEGRAIETENYGNLYIATELLNKRLVPIIIDVRARTASEFGELIRHDGEEYVFVFRGSIVVLTDLYAPVKLDAGDSIYLDAGMGHGFIAASPGTCRIVAVCSGDESKLLATYEKLAKASPRLENQPAHSAKPTPRRAKRKIAASGAAARRHSK